MDSDLIKNGIQPLRKDLMLMHQTLKQNRCLEDRIESAKKLVKKLHKFCPHYEVSINGEDAGRVYCKVCERHLGAVSSTLKNHVNTQEHKQALEDSINGNSNENNKINGFNKIACNKSSNCNNNQMNPTNTTQPPHKSNNNGLDLDFDIAWVPGFQSPNSVDYGIGICDNHIRNDNGNHQIIPTKAMTAL
jgi:hypothetical protein